MGARPELSDTERARLRIEAKRANRPGIMTEREWNMRRGAVAAAYGEAHYWPEPVELTEAEELYARARESFQTGRQSFGWDDVEKADQICGYDLG
jgi:hypothetical protein